MVRINITLPTRLLNLVDDEAKRLELSRSELIRRILDEEFDIEPPGEPT